MALAPPRGRKCGPRVKTGCQTCKIRRVKCDEAKPACQKCTSTGRKCDGYIIKGVSSSNLATNQGLVLLQGLSTCISGSAEERRGFGYFLNNTAPELSGYYDSSFWERLLPQVSMADPALRHAVIGIGSLHEAFANNRLDYSPDNTERSFAIKQYTKALGHLRRSLAAEIQQPLATLMSCILFVCFDSFRGHFASAMVHLESGLRIMRDLRIRSTADQHIIAESLAPAFMRLSIQAMLYLDTLPAPDRRAVAIEFMEFSESETSIPENFTTLDEARDSMNQATSGLFRMFYMIDPDLPYSAHPEIFPLYDKYSKQLADWSTAFERFMEANFSKLSRKQVRGAAMLKLQHTTVDIMASIAPPCIEDPRPRAEILSDLAITVPYLGHFEAIVKLSRSLIAASEEDSKNGRSPLNFSADVGVTGPLYYCGLVCPDPALRSAAIDLLRRYPRREGMWDSVSLERLIRGYWAIQEKQATLQNEFVSENADPGFPRGELELVFEDGMKWEWRQKEMAIRTVNLSHGNIGAEVLERGSWGLGQGIEQSKP